MGRNNKDYIAIVMSSAFILFKICLKYNKALYLLQGCKRTILNSYGPHDSLLLQIISWIAGIYITQRKYAKVVKFLKSFPSYYRQLLKRSEDFALKYHFIKRVESGRKVAKSFVDCL